METSLVFHELTESWFPKAMNECYTEVQHLEPGESDCPYQTIYPLTHMTLMIDICTYGLRGVRRVGDDCLQSQSLKQRVCVFCSLLNLCNRLSLFLLSLIQHNWSGRFLHALDVSISSWQHALSLFVSGQPRPQLDQSNPAAFCLAFCVTEHLSLCCNSIHFDNLAPKLSGWFLILHTALLICKHHTKATGEHIIIQRTSSQTDAVEPCDVGLINDMDWRAPAVGYVGQTN